MTQWRRLGWSGNKPRCWKHGIYKVSVVAHSIKPVPKRFEQVSKRPRHCDLVTRRLFRLRSCSSIAVTRELLMSALGSIS
jgi:hypothetical protein